MELTNRLGFGYEVAVGRAVFNTEMQTVIGVFKLEDRLSIFLNLVWFVFNCNCCLEENRSS